MPRNSIHKTISHELNVDDSALRIEGRLLQIHPINLDGGLITLGKEPFVIGRSSDCDLSIPNQAVSRKHVQFQSVEGGFEVVDLGSTNGTKVNGERVKTRQLKSGDRVQVGSRIFKFITTDEVEAKYHEAVYSMMTKDSLTGAWNKRYLLDVLKREIKRRARSKRSFGLIMIDVDHFKSINDQHSHLVGDEVLAEVASRIAATVRDEDVFARFGGEEFSIVVSEIELGGCLQVAERCRAAVSLSPITTSDAEVNCTISVGLAIVDEANPLSMKALLSAADKNLYKAKKAGRNRVCS